MRFTGTMAFLSIFSLASAGCYSGGAPWPDDHAATVHAIQSVSDQMAAMSPLDPGEHVINIGVQDKCLHFILDNISGSPRSISSNEALDGFTKEYTGCHNGGDTSYTNWRYV